MSPPLVSVLLPARNAENTVESAVRSVLAQSFGDFELLAVDDGSTDATGERLRALAREDHRVRVLVTQGLGICGALELARAEARGRFLARMDADDWSLPDRFARSVEVLEADPSLWGAGTQVEVFRDDRPASPNFQLYVTWLNSLTSPEKLSREQFIESPLCHPSVMLRSAAVAQVGGWREGDHPEDYALWLELLAQGGKLTVIPEVLHRWRDSDARLTRTDPRYRPVAIVALKARYLARTAAVQAGVTIWGAGNNGLKLARGLRDHGIRIVRLIDLHPRKIGQRVDGWEVVRPEQLESPRGEHVIIAVGSKGAREDIRGFLGARGWIEGPDFTCAA